MCKEDIRIKRKTASQWKPINNGLAAFATLFPPDPARLSLVLSANAGSDPTAANAISIGYRDGANVVAIACITQQMPSVVLRIEDIGQPLTGEIVAIDLGNGAMTGVVTAVRFNEELSEL